MVRVVSWNTGQGSVPPTEAEEVWSWLLDMGADLALLQEARQPPEWAMRYAQERGNPIECDPGGEDIAGSGPAPWRIAGYRKKWRSTVVKLSEQVRLDWLPWKSFATKEYGQFRVYRPGTIAAARVQPTASGSFEPFIVVSMYAPWEDPHPSTHSKWDNGFSDGSAHRIVSDLSAFIGDEDPSAHRILAAGDLNILHCYGEDGNSYWAGRYSSVFHRMEALVFSFVGPQYPRGRKACPPPKELPPGSNDVPTYRRKRDDPATATRQLDFVFASKGFAESVQVRALNDPDQWGPSDHCRIGIDVGSSRIGNR